VQVEWGIAEEASEAFTGDLGVGFVVHGALIQGEELVFFFCVGVWFKSYGEGVCC